MPMAQAAAYSVALHGHSCGTHTQVNPFPKHRSNYCLYLSHLQYAYQPKPKQMPTSPPKRGQG